MKIPRIIYDFVGATDGFLLAKGDEISKGMNNNPNFLTPDPSMADVDAALAAYRDALGTAKLKGSEAIALKKQVKEAFVNILILLANYVEDIAKGDRAVLLSSGFTISSENYKPSVLGAVTDFNVDQGKVSGSAVLSCKGIKHVKLYIFEYRLASAPADSKWEQVTSSDRICTITGLEPLKEYCFRMRALGPKNQVSYSEVVTKGIA